MPADDSSECQLSRRQPEDKIPSSASGSDNNNDNEKGQGSRAPVQAEAPRTTWQSVKYYFNRFRYYHYVFADTLDKYLSALCLWIINLYLRYFIGVGPQPSSVLDDYDDED